MLGWTLCCILQMSISTLDSYVDTDFQDYRLENLTAKLRKHFVRASNFKFPFFDTIFYSFSFNVHSSSNIRKFLG